MKPKKYIELEAAIKEISHMMHECFPEADEELDAVITTLKEIPAADVRPVVTCGKCKYGKYTGTEWFCDKHSGHSDKFDEDASYHEYHSKHWYCADGERKDRGQEDETHL